MRKRGHVENEKRGGEEKGYHIGFLWLMPSPPREKADQGKGKKRSFLSGVRKKTDSNKTKTARMKETGSNGGGKWGQETFRKKKSY